MSMLVTYSQRDSLTGEGGVFSRPYTHGSVYTAAYGVSPRGRAGMAQLTTNPTTIPSNNKTITWERLESLRLKRMGLHNKYSRHFNVLRTHTAQDKSYPYLELPGSTALTAGEAQTLAHTSNKPIFSTTEVDIERTIVAFVNARAAALKTS